LCLCLSLLFCQIFFLSKMQNFASVIPFGICILKNWYWIKKKFVKFRIFILLSRITMRHFFSNKSLKLKFPFFFTTFYLTKKYNFILVFFFLQQPTVFYRKYNILYLQRIKPLYVTHKIFYWEAVSGFVSLFHHCDHISRSLWSLEANPKW
jgi:hypothetical protein